MKASPDKRGIDTTLSVVVSVFLLSAGCATNPEIYHEDDGLEVVEEPVRSDEEIATAYYKKKYGEEEVQAKAFIKKDEEESKKEKRIRARIKQKLLRQIGVIVAIMKEDMRLNIKKSGLHKNFYKNYSSIQDKINILKNEVTYCLNQLREEERLTVWPNNFYDSKSRSEYKKVVRRWRACARNNLIKQTRLYQSLIESASHHNEGGKDL